MLALPLFLGAVALGVGDSNEPEQVPAYPVKKPNPNPVYQRAAENQIPGRYDNVPLLQSVYRDPAYALDAGVVGKMDFEGPLREPNVTPLGLGVLPATRRGTGVMLPDPITGDDFKPQKRENRDVDMFMPSGEHVQGRYEPPHLQADMRIRQLETKMQGGHGALDSFTHIPDGGATRNFAKGEVMTVREGGFHPRQRLYRVDELNRGRNQHSFRPGNPTYQIGKLGSVYNGTAPLGELQLNPNADVAEWYRAPEHSRGAQTAPAAEGVTVMPAVNRQTGLEYNPNAFCESGSTERCFAGVAGREGIAQEARRLLNRYVAPKIQNGAEVMGPSDAARGVTAGSYQVSDYSAEVAERAPQSCTYESNVMKQPVPHNARGNYTSYYEDQRHKNTLRDFEGRPSGANRAINGAADGGSFVRFYDVQPRDSDKKLTGLDIEAIHAPNTTRSMAMQRQEEFYEPVSRRVTPFITQEPAYDLRSPIINNPYAQPLPHAPK